MPDLVVDQKVLLGPPAVMVDAPPPVAEPGALQAEVLQQPEVLAVAELQRLAVVALVLRQAAEAVPAVQRAVEVLQREVFLVRSDRLAAALELVQATSARNLRAQSQGRELFRQVSFLPSERAACVAFHPLEPIARCTIKSVRAFSSAHSSGCMAASCQKRGSAEISNARRTRSFRVSYYTRASRRNKRKT